MIISQKSANQILKDGGLVALPTETVYGLAASIFHPLALEKIFTTKERPYFDPLIVHVSDLKMAKTLSKEWNKLEVFLTQLFWPGPLTIIKEKSKLVSDIITSSLPSVALRSPQHPIMQKILADLEIPLAAPSANKFKATSPTTAEHVELEFEQCIPVVDGGPCTVGIESTIVEVLYSNHQYKIFIYRPGIITREEILQKLENTIWEKCTIEYKSSQVAPGQLQEHYRPKKPMTLVLTPLAKLSSSNYLKSDGHIQPLSTSVALAARELYAHIRTADLESHQDHLELFFAKEFWSDPQWFPIRERLEKACSKILNQ